MALLLMLILNFNKLLFLIYYSKLREGLLSKVKRELVSFSKRKRKLLEGKKFSTLTHYKASGQVIFVDGLNTFGNVLSVKPDFKYFLLLTVLTSETHPLKLVVYVSC